MSIVIHDTTIHFKLLLRSNLAAVAARDTAIAADFTRVALTPAQVQHALLAMWIANVTINSDTNVAKGQLPRSATKGSVYWRNVQFVLAHMDAINNLGSEDGLDVGLGGGFTPEFKGIFTKCF